MPMTIGRNDPCPCGSGKKYKKCCQPQQEVISLEAVRSDNLSRELWNKLSEFMGRNAASQAVAEGFARFFAHPLPDDGAVETGRMAMDWVTFAYRAADGTTLCEQFAASGKGLTAAEREVLRAWAASTPGFFRVEAAGGCECQLSRLADERAFAVRDPGVSLKAGDLVSAWLLPVNATYRFGYLVQELEPGMLTPLMHLVGIEMELLRRQRPAATWDELFREHWPRLTDAVSMAAVDGESVLAVTAPPGPSLRWDGKIPADASPKWLEVAELIKQAVETDEDWLEPEDAEAALRLWWDGALALRPRVVGARGWAAAVLYLYLRDVLGDDATQAEVAELCITSAATVGKYSRELYCALKPIYLDPRYVGLMEPYVRMDWRMYCLDAMGIEAQPPAPSWSEEEAGLLERAMLAAARQLADEKPEGPVRQAEELIDEAWEASGSRRTRLAEKALKLWPDGADAYVILGQAAEARGDLPEARRLFEQGVAAGERALGPEFFADNVGHFYGMIESRPYMRARAGLAGCLWEVGEREAAVAHYEEMLRLNPGDNQGIRYLLAVCYLTMGDDRRLGRLLLQYADEASAAIAFTRALWQYRHTGPGKSADKLLKEAAAGNPHVPAYLLGEKPLPSQPPAYLDFGGELEAVGYAWDFGEGWRQTPGALEWLRSKRL